VSQMGEDWRIGWAWKGKKRVEIEWIQGWRRWIELQRMFGGWKEGWIGLGACPWKV
jgi:hypothetical protein